MADVDGPDWGAIEAARQDAAEAWSEKRQKALASALRRGVDFDGQVERVESAEGWEQRYADHCKDELQELMRKHASKEPLDGE